MACNFQGNVPGGTNNACKEESCWKEKGEEALSHGFTGP
jgi:hypothetical protein